MLMRSQPPLHLTYCLNIHPGETWAENLAAIREHATAVKARVAPDRSFGLGLRLSRAAAEDLRAPAARRRLREELADRGLYAFTINGFPYGRFHGARVKAQVYAPDWRTAERWDYTTLLADILADLLPDGVSGSISTLPGSFKPWIRSAADARSMAEQLAAAAQHLAGLREQTGRELHLGLEPEPFCFLETTDEVIRFFDGPLAAACAGTAQRERVRRHLGVCLDTCHAALQFESPLAALRRYRAAGLRVSKIQLSAALEVAVKHGTGRPPTPERGNAGQDAPPTEEEEGGIRKCRPSALTQALAAFDEPVYLHQTKARLANGALLAWTDLTEALPALAQRNDVELVRVHYHVPLFWEGGAPLRSTAPDLNADFFREAVTATEHLEIETYTFDVLPTELRAGGVVDSVAREFDWVRPSIAAAREP
ncbi:MAG: metabolite traffic protein EboE [Kiritimatiellaeota bacterium]|nr:metabolite traffic protein EboE [Kiritimatiellota bacterium]